MAYDNKEQRRVFSGVTVVLCGMAGLSSVLAHEPVSAVVAIALNTLAIIWMIFRWRQSAASIQEVSPSNTMVHTATHGG